MTPGEWTSCHDQALSENQPQDIALARTEGDTHANLTRPLLRRIRDHAVEARDPAQYPLQNVSATRSRIQQPNRCIQPQRAEVQVALVIVSS